MKTKLTALKVNDIPIGRKNQIAFDDFPVEE